MRFTTLGAVILLVAGGCANNAIFTLHLDLPPAPPGPPVPRPQLVVEGRAATGLVMADWTADWQQWQAGGIPLNATVRTTASVDFVASGATVTEPLWVKIRFCVSEVCTDVDDGVAPEVRVAFERVFFQGRYTEYTLPIAFGLMDGDVLDTSMTPVPKCMVAAPDCIDGMPATDWCIDGQHWCER
jgi:hypothetical protein